MSKLRYSSLIFVSKNSFKLQEYRAILKLPRLEMLDIPTTDPQDMNLETLARNKIEKVKPILRNTPFFVEHTGLIIEAWNGLPGGLTKQFVDTVGCAGLCKMLTAYQGVERQARVKTVIGYFNANNIQIFEGNARGTITTEPRGVAAWDWDAIFIPEGYTQTYAEMGQVEKNRLSMRQKAVTDFAHYLSNHFKRDEDAPEEIFESTGEDIKRLIKHHQRRLQKLKEQKALYGLSADPSIPIEIEDIEAEIENLKAELSEIR